MPWIKNVQAFFSIGVKIGFVGLKFEGGKLLTPPWGSLPWMLVDLLVTLKQKISANA